jgi:Flp pilus assembly protein TadD
MRISSKTSSKHGSLTHGSLKRGSLQRGALLCAGALLLACAGPRSAQRDGATTTTTTMTTAATASADDAYLSGRGAHLAGREDAALAAYRTALARDPTHLKARNGLATLYAGQGDFAPAIALWQAMTQEGQGAGGQASAFLYSNLGYAHFLNGQFEQALAALEKACLLDPLDARAWDHLGGALDKLGQHQRAQQMYRQAGALRTHDFKADYLLAERAGVAAIDSAVRAGPKAAAEPAWDRTELRQDDAGVFVLQRVGAAAGGAGAPAAPALPAAALASTGLASLEIRNGNGVNGMARALAGSMDREAVRVVRLSNQKGFGVRHTRIEYQADFREAAERLAVRFGAARVVARVVASDHQAQVGRADLRLVIGRDLVPGAPTRAPALAAAPAGVPPRPVPGQG